MLLVYFLIYYNMPGIDHQQKKSTGKAGTHSAKRGKDGIKKKIIYRKRK